MIKNKLYKRENQKVQVVILLKLNIINNEKVIINLSNNDISKINNIISIGKNKFAKKIDKLKKEELLSVQKYDFKINKKIVIKHKKLVFNIINFVIKKYKKEFKGLELVFLSCSFGRQTNKLESDLDLHFIYKTNEYKYEIEEIVCYIITQILEKNRDDIDPKLIINFDKLLKKECESLMTDNDLEIILKSEKEKITYQYLSSKKKKFFLQYNNSKKINDLEKYILYNGILEKNLPWAHSYSVIYGKKIFKKMYSKLYNIEKKLLTDNYYNNQIRILINELNSIDLDISEKNISIIKKNYQTNVFTSFYKYLNIVRLYYIKKGKNIRFLKIYELYDKVDDNFKQIIDYILIYIWEIKKMSIYCSLNNISYSIHTNEFIKYYDLKKLDELFQLIKRKIIYSLKEMEK